jgi:ketosteroid isomerase-like protein
MTSANKETVQRYMEGFIAGDHAKILSCLTEDVVWEVPGVFHITGKAAFDKEIENEHFIGFPNILITRLVEENDVVVAEGTVHSAKAAGGFLDLVFCDVFIMENTKIKKLTSYLMELSKG